MFSLDTMLDALGVPKTEVYVVFPYTSNYFPDVESHSSNVNNHMPLNGDIEGSDSVPIAGTTKLLKVTPYNYTMQKFANSEYKYSSMDPNTQNFDLWEHYNRELPWFKYQFSLRPIHVLDKDNVEWNNQYLIGKLGKTYSFHQVSETIDHLIHSTNVSTLLSSDQQGLHLHMVARLPVYMFWNSLRLPNNVSDVVAIPLAAGTRLKNSSC